MFFVLSKVLYFLLLPFCWIIILLIWRWLAKRASVKKVLLIVIIGLLIVFTNPLLYHVSVSAWQPKPVDLPRGQTYEAAIVLGGLSGYDKNQRGYFGNNADRFIQTANLYHQGVVKKILISGGSGTLSQKDPPEAVFLRQQFIANGVADSAIIIEGHSRNTYENAIYSKKLADSLHLKFPLVLVTSALHMRRSAAVFKKAGFDFVALPCDYKVTPANITLESFIPDGELLYTWSHFIKEMVGLTVYRLTGKA